MRFTPTLTDSRTDTRTSPSPGRGRDRGQVQIALIIGAAVLMAGIVGAVMAYEQVDDGHVGVERIFGDVTGETYTPGAHLIAPWKAVQAVETRPRTYTMSGTEGEGEQTRSDAIVVQSVDGTTHNVDVTIRYRVVEEEAPVFVEEWRDEGQMEARLIRPTVRSQMRDEAAAIPTAQIYRAEGRERLASAARESLDEEFAGQPIVLEAVQVRDVTLPADYATELEQREVARAEIERRQHQVEVEQQEAERKRVAAEADAEVIRIEGEAIRNNPEILELRYIEAIENSDNMVIVGGEDGTPAFILDTQTGETRPAPDGAGASGNQTTSEEVLGG